MSEMSLCSNGTVWFEHYELTPDELNESLKRLAETKTLKELSLKPLQYFPFNTSTIRTLHFFELTSLHLQCDLNDDRRYEIIADVQPNLTNLDLDYDFDVNVHLHVIVYLIKNVKKSEKFQVSLPATVEKEFLDQDLLIGISQESTARPALTVKLRDSYCFKNVGVLFFKERVHKVITFARKETFQYVELENYRPWCVDEL